jgi:hypothetical protein
MTEKPLGDESVATPYIQNLDSVEKMMVENS